MNFSSINSFIVIFAFLTMLYGISISSVYNQTNQTNRNILYIPK